LVNSCKILIEMKKIFVLAFFSFVSLTAQAQYGGGGGVGSGRRGMPNAAPSHPPSNREPKEQTTAKEFAEKITTWMKKDLLLTDTVVIAKVQVINLQFAHDQETMFKEVQAIGDFSVLENRREGLEMAHSTELKTVLTDAQWQKYRKLAKKRMDSLMGR
jgi:hypothetical protein